MLSRLVGSVTQALDFNAATLSGCIDIIVVPQEDGSLKSTPFHVRFGKARVLRSRDKVVEVWVNGDDTGIRMRLGAAGEAYFIMDDESQPILDNESVIEKRHDQTIKPLPKISDYDSSETDLSDDATNLENTEEQNRIENISADPSWQTPTRLADPHEPGSPLKNLPFAVEFSVCGHILQGGELDVRVDNDVFEANKIQFDVMNTTPELWFHPSLVARFNGEPPFYPAKAAMPVVMTLLTFKKSMTPDAVFRLMNSTVSITPPEGSLAHLLTTAGLSPLAQLVQHEHPHDIKSPKKQNEIDLNQVEEDVEPPTSSPCDASVIPNCTTICNPQEKPEGQDQGEIIREAQKSLEIPVHNLPSTTSEVDGSITIKKTLRPTADQLSKMCLQWGENVVEFRLSGSSQNIKGTIYLWERDAKIVVSDVDGTITRSDVMGQLAPMVGKDWSHTAVTKLFTRIQRSGFHMLYLTARAIGQADITRDYLFGLADGANGSALPRGPLFLSPDRLFTSFKREVIDRTPFVFKIAALRDIRGLFPPSYNPFYAGFGNRDTDHKAYTHIGIPEGKVFIINSSGIVHHVNSAYATSYESMADIAHQMFPHLQQTPRHCGLYNSVTYRQAIQKVDSNKFFHDDEFNDFDFWAQPLPNLDSSSSDSLAQFGVNNSSIEDNEEPITMRMSSQSGQGDRPVSRELIGLRRKIIRAKTTEEITDPIDITKALQVTPFAELAQMYSILNDLCPPNEQAELLGLYDGSAKSSPKTEMAVDDVTFDSALDAITTQSTRDEEMLESIIKRETTLRQRNPSCFDLHDDEIWQTNSLLTKLEDRIWDEMLELKKIYCENERLEEATSQILGFKYEAKPKCQEMIDPGIWPLDPVSVSYPSIPSPSSLFKWASSKH